MQVKNVLQSWGKILSGHTPLLSIEITRECPLHCPGCYAYGADHLGGNQTLRDLSDKRGDDLVQGVISLVDRYKPLHVTLVGGEPMVRHREVNSILPELARRNVFTMIVTSGIIVIPASWTHVPNLNIAVSVDGLPEHHDVRRHPATYERILKNIAGRQVNIHWTITAPMLERDGYIEEYVSFWSQRPEVHNIWVSLYSPQRGEDSMERLSIKQRKYVARELPRVRQLYPKLLTPEGYVQALLDPPMSPSDCTFSRMSRNYSADLKTHVEPCVFGGDPDCSQCGCSASAAVNWIREYQLLGALKARHLLHASMLIGSTVAALQSMGPPAWRERELASPSHNQDSVQISTKT